MDIKEKILLLEVLMLDIRSSWDNNIEQIIKDPRVQVILDLLDEFTVSDYCILVPCDSCGKSREKTLDTIINYTFYSTLGLYLTGRYEGRVFRDSCDRGGYEGLENIHGLTKEFSSRSEEYKTMVKKYCRTDFAFCNE